jgi:hypothetical protein
VTFRKVIIDPKSALGDYSGAREQDNGKKSWGKDCGAAEEAEREFVTKFEARTR